MNMFKLFTKALLAAALTFGAAQANDTTFGGEGVTLLPIENENITMVDEHIVLEGYQGTKNKSDGWKATCTFHFKNETDKPQTITMGFPFHRYYEVSSEWGSDSWEEQKKTLSKDLITQLELPQIRSFTTKVRGAAVKSKEIKLEDKTSTYHNAWVWEVTFAPGEAIEVVNTYEHDYSGSVEGDEFINYVLKTGKNWKGGKIGRSLLEVRPKKDFVLDFFREHQVLPKGAKIEADGQFKKVVWDLKDFTPETDLFFHFRPVTGLLQFARTYLSNEEFFESRVDDQSCKSLRQGRNAYYAWFGYPFKSADLKAYFGKQWWYKEDPNFDIKKLPAAQQELIGLFAKYYKQLEKKNGCK